jgi:8-oxo-dGTP pyrophosphatase MutT (NUDIX family)
LPSGLTSRGPHIFACVAECRMESNAEVPMSKSKQPKRVKSPGRTQQYAALPVRFNGDGRLEVLLLTSRGTRRWVIPKGWPMPKLAPSAAAAREAYEEAGIEGIIRPGVPVGNYHYAKNVEAGQLPIKVFLLRVERQLDAWPEQAERETRWFSPEEAAELVAEPELAAILLSARNIIAWAGR